MPKILFAVDGSEHSLHTAATLAEIATGWKGSELHILNVQAEPVLYGEVAVYVSPAEAESFSCEAGERALAAPLALLQESSMPCTSEVLLGDAAANIVSAARRHGCTLITMGSHGTGAFASRLMGTVASQVIHLSSIPVLVIPSTTVGMSDQKTQTRRGTRILMPVDGSAGALAALREIIRIASWFEIAPEIHLLVVYDRTPLDVQIAAMISAEVLRQHELRQFEVILKQARVVLSGANFKVVEHTAIGQLIEEIHSIAKSHHCDLICMGTHSRGGVGNLVLGSVVTKLLHVMNLPVVVVPPIGS